MGGVYGDGWFPGVELTRDGRALSAHSSAQGRQAWNERLEEARFGPRLDRSASSGVIGQPYQNHQDRETDRYGFFLDSAAESNAASTGDQRIFLLAAAAYREKGTAAASSSAPPKAVMAAARSPSAAELEKETSRTVKWQDMLSHAPVRSSAWSLRGTMTGDAKHKKKVGWLRCVLAGLIGERQLRKRIYKGIPDRWRAAVWPILASMTADWHPVPALVQGWSLRWRCPWSDSLQRLGQRRHSNRGCIRVDSRSRRVSR
jgi:hypothetical protein